LKSAYNHELAHAYTNFLHETIVAQERHEEREGKKLPGKEMSWERTFTSAFDIRHTTQLTFFNFERLGDG
jgi:hypothetical protein